MDGHHQSLAQQVRQPERDPAQGQRQQDPVNRHQPRPQHVKAGRRCGKDASNDKTQEERVRQQPRQNSTVFTDTVGVRGV